MEKNECQTLSSTLSESFINYFTLAFIILNSIRKRRQRVRGILMEKKLKTKKVKRASLQPFLASSPLRKRLLKRNCTFLIFIFFLLFVVLFVLFLLLLLLLLLSVSFFVFPSEWDISFCYLCLFPLIFVLIMINKSHS